MFRGGRDRLRVRGVLGRTPSGRGGGGTVAQRERGGGGTEGEEEGQRERGRAVCKYVDPGLASTKWLKYTWL